MNILSFEIQENQQDWIFSEEFLRDSASIHDGYNERQEKENRYKTIWFIEDLSKKIESVKLNRKIISAASVFFHRFYAFHSFKHFNRFKMAIACFFLASKVEECVVKLKDIIHAYYSLKKLNPSEAEVRELNKDILKNERILLSSLNFDLNLIHPYNILMAKLKDFKNYINNWNERKDDVIQTCINFLNDSYRTSACLQFTPAHIAMSVFFLTTIQLSLVPCSLNSRISSNLTWFDILEQDIDEYTLKKCSNLIILEFEGNEKTWKESSFLNRLASACSGTSLSHPSPTGVAVTISSHESVEESKSFDNNSNFMIGEDEIDFNYNDEIKKEANVKVTIVKNAATLNHEEYTKINNALLASSVPTVVTLQSESNDSNGTPFYINLPTSVASATPEFPSLPPTPFSLEAGIDNNMERLAKKQKL